MMTPEDDETRLSPTEVAPLMSLTSDIWGTPPPPSLEKKEAETTTTKNKNREQQKEKVGQEVVKALQTSGFLLIQSDLMPDELQQQALRDATQWLNQQGREEEEDSMVITHPTDPKTYVMLEPKHLEEEPTLQQFITPTLQRYWQACDQLKKYVLRAIGVGLALEHPEDLASWHNEGTHSAMRLLHYPPAQPTTGNRCKAHSDYGTVTLLSTNGVSGLEIYLHGKWWPVPYIAGSVVVNIGSLLSEWTQSSLQSPLLATMHRVAGPASENSTSDPRVLQEAMKQGRTSIAFFADPDDDTPLCSSGGMTMKEYIHWRSGGTDANRSGVAFTSSEKEIIMAKKD